MKRNSLQLRLLVSAAIATAVAVGLTGVALSYLFQNYAERRVYSELEIHLNQLTENLEVSEDGSVSVRGLADLRFNRPLSGLYWQVQVDDGAAILSRSLWDQALAYTSSATKPNTIAHSIISGLDGEVLLAVDWAVKVKPRDAEHQVRLLIATGRDEIVLAANAFTRQLAMWLTLLGGALVLATWVQVGVGLRPLETLRERVAEVASGNKKRLDETYPREITPLVEEINNLLAQQDSTIERSRARASDLAHGLKTPLSILSAISRRIRSKKSDNTSAQIQEQITVMHEHIEHELARARLGIARGASCNVSAVCDRMITAIKKLPAESTLTWSMNVPPGLVTAVEARDCSEVLGNILDNARKWAAHRVDLHASTQDGAVIITVEDDGPGVPPDKLGLISDRGRRLDKNKQGSGLGLSIAKNIVTEYSGEILFFRSPLGGLGVRVCLPAVMRKS